MSTSPPPPRSARRPGSRALRLTGLDWVPDLVVVADAQGRIVFANRAAATLTGYRSQELVGKAIEFLVPERLRAAHRRSRKAYYAGRTGSRPMGSPDHDFMVCRKDGTEFSADISLNSVRTAEGEHTVSVIRDISDRKRLESALEHQALHDPLTGLANRILFFDRLNQSLLSARRDRKQVALVMLDLDRFKDVNDAHGHAAGDDVLKEIGVRLGSGLRASDTLARIGGDEFAWIMPRVKDQADVERAVTDRLQMLKRTLLFGKSRVEIAASAGIAVYPHDGRDADSLIRHADAAMYSAKRERRGVAFYPRQRPRSSG